MTNLHKFLYENSGNCKFIFENGTTSAKLTINDSLLFWTNFAGEPNRFGNTARNFNVVISEEVKEWLDKSGKIVKIHQMGGEKNEETGEVEPIVYSINVKVKMQGPYPPEIRLFTEYRGQKSFQDLTEETLACLDHAHIVSSDCIINLKESRDKPGHYLCYLQKLYAIQEKRVEFDGKYDSWLEPELVGPEEAAKTDNED